MARQIHWVSQSSDKKIGKVMASYSPIESCPDSCSLKTGGCYAWGLFYLRSLGRKIASGSLNKSIEESFLKVRSSAKIVRHRVAGDIVGDVKDTYDECKFVESKGLINIGYTHDWKSKDSQVLKEYFRASCNNLKEVEQARSMGWATTLIVSEETPNKAELPNGERAIMCPVVVGERKIEANLDSMVFENKKERSAERKKMRDEFSSKINCNSCTLCKVTEKTEDITVMFEVHGAASTLNQAKGKYESIS